MDIYSTITDIATGLQNGKTLLYPTDTIWGLGCSALDQEALSKIYALKNRPQQKSMILLVSDWQMLSNYVHLSSTLKEELQLLLHETEIPTTLIFPNTRYLPHCVLAENGSVGMRIPKHEFCVDLIRELNAPLVSTSANIAGEKSPLSFKDIPDTIKQKVDMVADPVFDTSTYNRPSRILLLSENGDIEAIR